MKIKTKYTKIILGIVVAIAGMVIGVRQVHAGFGVSPSNIYHEYLKPGGHFEQKITLSRSDPYEDLEIIVEPALEEMRDWFSFDPGVKFIFPKGQNRITLTAIIDVPVDAPYKAYEGVIRVKAMTAGAPSGGVAIVKGARLDVNLLTTELNITELEVTSMKMQDVSGGETLKLDIKATNKGNVEISPTAKVVIMNLQMQALEELEANDFGVIGPNKTEDLVAQFETKLGTGEYFAEASVLVDGIVVRKERLVFRISDRTIVAELSQSTQWDKVTEFLADQNSSVKTAIGIFIAIIILVGLYLLLKLKGNPRLKVLIAGLVIAGMFMGVSWYQSQQVEQPNPEESVVEGEGDVQGTATIFKVSDRGEPLLVKTEDGEMAYPIYRESSSTSEIVFYANEDDEFAVIEERANWYRIVLPDATGGWLAKESVKQTTVEER